MKHVIKGWVDEKDSNPLDWFSEIDTQYHMAPQAIYRFKKQVTHKYLRLGPKVAHLGLVEAKRIKITIEIED